MSFIYTFILVLILLTSIYEMYGGQKPSREWFYTIVAVMALTSGFAYAISPDWIPYWNAFEGASLIDIAEIPALAESMDMEIGYIFLNKFVSLFGLGYASFTVIISFIALYLKSTTIYKYSGYVFLGLLMYMVPAYFFEEHVHVRQGLASAITVFSVRYIVERKLYYFLICFVIAFLFHKAAVVFLLAYWIATLKFNNTMVGGIVLVAIIANYTGLSAAIDGLMQFMPFGVAETYNDYANATVVGSILGDIVKVLTVIAILLFNTKATKNDPHFAYFRNIYLFGVVLYFFFGRGIFAARLPGFYTIFIIFLVPRMIMALKDNTTFRNFVYVSFTTYTILLYVNFYVTWGDKSGFGNYTSVFNEWVPYSFFEKK